MLCKNYYRFEGADPTQNHGIMPLASIQFEQEYEQVGQNQYEDRWRTPELTAPGESGRIGSCSNRTRGIWIWSARFQMAKRPDLLSQLSGRMQNLDNSREPSGRFVISLRGEFRHFSQSDRR